MPLSRVKGFVVILTFALSFRAAAADQKASTQDIDRSVKPGDDFYRYANGAWLKREAIPVGRTSYDTRAILTERTSQRVRGLIQAAAGAKSARGSVSQKVGDYYASFIDVDGIEAKGLTPLAGELAGISAIANRSLLSAYLGTTLNTEVDGLTANADHIFGVWVNQSFEDSKRCVFHLLQGGLGLPDREDYISSSPEIVLLRNQYKAHIAAILRLAGAADSENKAE